MFGSRVRARRSWMTARHSDSGTDCTDADSTEFTLTEYFSIESPVISPPSVNPLIPCVLGICLSGLGTFPSSYRGRVEHTIALREVSG